MSMMKVNKLLPKNYSSLSLDELRELRSKLEKELKELDDLIDSKYEESCNDNEILDLCDHRALINVAKGTIENFFYKKKLNIEESKTMSFGTKKSAYEIGYLGMKFVPEKGR